MTAVYVIRHPQTTWNVEERYQGRLESHWSAEGERQACLAAATFPAGQIAMVYSSPLQRARLLAELISEHARSPLVVDNRLTEIAMGPWEGLYRRQIKDRFPAMFQNWYARPDLVRFPGGESPDDVQVRSLSSLADIFAKHPDSHVCIVTHSAVVQVMACAALGLELRHLHRVHSANAGITTLCGSGAPGSLIAMNATQHMYDSPVASGIAQKCAEPAEGRFVS